MVIAFGILEERGLCVVFLVAAGSERNSFYQPYLKSGLVVLTEALPALKLLIVSLYSVDL